MLEYFKRNIIFNRNKIKENLFLFFRCISLLTNITLVFHCASYSSHFFAWKNFSTSLTNFFLLMYRALYVWRLDLREIWSREWIIPLAAYLKYGSTNFCILELFWVFNMKFMSNMKNTKWRIQYRCIWDVVMVQNAILLTVGHDIIAFFSQCIEK